MGGGNGAVVRRRGRDVRATRGIWSSSTPSASARCASPSSAEQALPARVELARGPIDGRPGACRRPALHQVRTPDGAVLCTVTPGPAYGELEALRARQTPRAAESGRRVPSDDSSRPGWRRCRRSRSSSPSTTRQESLDELLASIEQAMAPSSESYEVVFVDDGSTDGSSRS